jgi:nucleoside-diphosphate-sugar epimerase
MKILVTGARLVGCHAAHELTSQGHRVWLFDASPNRAYVEAITRAGVLELGGSDELYP